MPSFGFTPSSASTAPSISVPASSAAAYSFSSSTTSSFTGFGVTSAASTTPSLGATGFNFSKLSTPASSSQAQSTTTAPVFSEFAQFCLLRLRCLVIVFMSMAMCLFMLD